MTGLPYGTVDVSGEAFASSCEKIPAGALASWISEAPAKVEIKAGEIAKATLKLVADPRVEIVTIEETGKMPTGAQRAFRRNWFGSER